MTTVNNQPDEGDYPAFPITAGNQVYANGLTKRDWFAGQVMVGFHQHGPMSKEEAMSAARSAYRLADLMIAASKESNQ